MKLSSRTWVILLFVLILAGAVVLYMMYNNKLDERERALDSKAQAELFIPALESQKAGLEEELAGLEQEYAELNQRLEELNITLESASNTLAESQNRLRLVVESIEYGEQLFALAESTGVEITSIVVSDPGTGRISGINYDITGMHMEISGLEAEILAFIDSVANHESLKTATIAPVSISVAPPMAEPEPIDIDGIRDTYYQQILAENLAALEPETLVNIIQEVTFDMFGLTIEDNTMDERIAFITELISAEFGENLREDLAEKMAEDLANAIEQLIADQLAGKVAVYWGAAISEILTPVVETILEGEEGTTSGDEWADMFTWMGDEVEGSIQGSLTSIISGYISDEIQQKTAEIVEPDANQVEALTQAEVTRIEEERALVPPPDSSASMNIEIYNYPG
ncbi:MAG: hypothetical protein PHG45_05260 [Dehalococcoidales bacterium]|nr:hypothetical protein [Dehalococcoidales bacterium]